MNFLLYVYYVYIVRINALLIYQISDPPDPRLLEEVGDLVTDASGTENFSHLVEFVQ